MGELVIVLAVTDSIWHRLGVLAGSLVVGTLLILAGWGNIKTETAEESGKGRLVNRVLGRSSTYEGARAVRVGWTRVVCGIGLIIFGIVFVFVGPFLAE